MDMEVAFGLSDAVSDERDTTDVEQEQSTDVLQSEEGTENPTADGDELEPSTNDSPEESDEDTSSKEKRKSLEDAHRFIVDLIEDQFNSLDAGNLSGKELQEWFKENETFAEVANRSKRMKERYRSFIEKDHTVTAEDTPTSDEDDENRPMTVKEFKRLSSLQQETLLKNGLRRAEKAEFEAFATNLSIKGNDATNLRETADAIYRVNDSMEYSQALNAAHRALYAGKGTPIQITGANSQGGVAEKPVVEETVDLSEWSAGMDAKAFGIE